MNGQIVALLSAYGVLTTMRREGHRLFGRCPVHGGDNPRAFVVDLERDCWYCFSRCGRGGGPVALARGLGLPAPQGGVPAPPPPAPFTPYTRALSLDPRCAWLQAKGIWPATAARYEAGAWHGTGMLSGCVAVRLRGPGGEPLGYAGRRLDPVAVERRGKWVLPRAFPKSETLYGWHLADSSAPVFVTECPWGVMRLAQLGLSAVALLGTRLSGAQAGLLRRPKRVVLMLDGDEAGRAGAERAALAIGASAVVAALPEGRDPDDVSDAFLREMTSFLL